MCIRDSLCGFDPGHAVGTAAIDLGQEVDEFIAVVSAAALYPALAGVAVEVPVVRLEPLFDRGVHFDGRAAVGAALSLIHI